MGRRDRIVLCAIAVILAVSVLAVGGAPRWAQAIVAFCGATGMVFVVRSRRSADRLPPLLLMIWFAAAWTVVQYVPLPSSLVAALSPTLDGLRRDGAALAGLDVPSTLSMDRPGTLRALTFYLTLSTLALLALRAAITERGRYYLLASVAALAGLAATVCGLHELFGAERLFGLYEPRDSRPVVLGPLLNTNHLGCLMAIGTSACVGLLMYPKQPPVLRASWAVVAVGCAVTAFASLSRGAVISLAIGTATVLLVSLLQRLQAFGKRSRQRRTRFLTTTVPIGVMVVCALTIAVYIGAGSVMSQLENTTFDEVDEPTSKFRAWRSSLTLVEESPWVGVGRGAFEPTFTRVHPPSAFATFATPENEAVVILVEMGVPAALVLGAILIWVLSIAVTRWRDGPLVAGALGALAAVGFQSNFDFGLELLGIAAPTVVLLAMLTYVPLTETTRHRLSRLRVLRVAQLLGALAGSGLLLMDATRGVDEDHVSLQSSVDRSELDEILERHPLDYLAFGVMAESMVRAKDPAAIPVLNHALRLHPTHVGLHRLAARLLLRANLREQAATEYKIAMRNSKDVGPILLEVAAHFSAAEAASIVPLGLDLQRVTQLLESANRSDLLLLWLQKLVLEGRNLRAAEVLHTRAMRIGDYGAAEVATKFRCEKQPSPRCNLEHARILAAAGKQQEVIETLEDVAAWTGRTDEKLAAWLLRCDAFIAIADRDGALECLRRLDVSGLVPPDHAYIRQRRRTLEETTKTLVP